ncbi:hypothetical protein D9615_004232 [Tricholomella constricta]|uniref:Glycoside hydrolase family 79 protein n=1 Tax=Tricholomella constricta TaxID=117010 RepID=A0A8H5HET8_9AGAR|nr:hypothetical protein D9615_004232 [Tricholomella constricta]
MISLPFLCLILLGQQVSGVNVPIPLFAPSNAASVSPSLFSFSIEQDRWTDWAGSTSRNQFLFNTLDNLGRLTGAPPDIRVGANSEDRTKFNAAIQATQLVFPAITTIVPYPEAINITVGDAFYQATQFLPPNTRVIWGLNLGQNNLTTAFLEAKSIVRAFSSSAVKDMGIVLDAIEIGNEADLYRNNGARPRTYNATQWTSFATNVTSALGISSTSTTKFWGAAFAGSSHSTSGFSPQSVFNQGLLSSTAGSFISTISQHHYSGSFCSGSEGLLQDLMTKSTIRGNLSSFIPDITATRTRGLDYVFGETNSYSCHGAPGVSNTAGAALWTLDYVLFALVFILLRNPTRGTSHRTGHKSASHECTSMKVLASNIITQIQPTTLTRSILDGSTLPSPLPPHVQPAYYGAIVAAEAIGASGSTRVIELSIDNNQITGYAFYEGKKLVRAVLINSNAFLQGSANRASVHLDFSFTGNGMAPTKASVKRLVIGHADDQSGLKWGGQTYETSDGRPTKRYTSMSETSSKDGLTLLFAHCLGSHKEQWEPTIERIFHLQQSKDTRDRIREAWAFDWQSHGDAAVLNEEVLKTRDDAVSAAEWALALESFVSTHLKGHRIVALGHSAGTAAIMMSVKSTPVQKPPYIAIFLIEPTILSQELFDAHARERKIFANMSMKVTLERRDTWPDRETAAAYFRRRLPWKSWDPRVFDIYVNHGLRTVTSRDGNAVVLKASKRQEGLAYPHFPPYIEATTLFTERCNVIPFHIIYGGNIDFIPKYIQESLCDTSKGRKPASVTKVLDAGHLIVQEDPDGLARAICDKLDGKNLQISSRM